MARLAALCGLIGALLVAVDAYSTCADSVHEWIRFHDFVTEEQRMFIKLLKRSLGTTTYGGGDFLKWRRAVDPSMNIPIYSEWERIVQPYGDPLTWGWPKKANRYTDEMSYEDKHGDGLSCADASHLSFMNRKLPCVVDSLIQSTNSRSSKGYQQWGKELDYDTNLDFCEDVVQGMSLGFHSGCGKEWEISNCIAEDDGWMFKNRADDGCPYKVEFEVNDMIARGAAFLTCARYTYWDQFQAFSNNEDGSISRSRAYGGNDVAWSGIGMILTSGSWNPLKGIKSANQRGAYDMSCGSVASEAHMIDERSSDEQTVCWRFVKDIHDLVCHYEARDDGMLWGLASFIENLDPADPSTAAEFAQHVPHPMYQELAERLRKSRGGSPGKAIRAQYVDHGPMATWPGWDKTDEACSADEKAVKDGNGLIDMVVEAAVDGEDMSEYLESEGDLAELAQKSDTWQIDTFHDQRFNGPTCLDPDTKWKLINDEWAESEDETEPMFKMIGAKDNGDGGTLQKPTEVAPPGGGGGSSRSSKASSKASSTSSRFVSYYSTYKSYMALKWSRTKKENAARWLDNELGSVGRGSAKALMFASSSLDALFFGIENSLIKTAMAHGVCESPVKAKPGELTVSRFTADRKCKCEVVEPILEALHEAESKSAAIRADMEAGGREIKAITLMYSKGAGAHASALGVGASAGMYVTFQWSPYYMFDVGGTTGMAHSVNLGTDIVKAGAHVEFKLGIFFGKQNEISAYRKGIDFGLDVHAKVGIGVEIMFLNEYMGKRGDELVLECTPLFSSGYNAAAGHALRMLTFPAAPRCINGFAVTVMAGVSTTPSVGCFNVYTSHSVSRSVSLFALSSLNEHGRLEVEAGGQPVRNYGRMLHAAMATVDTSETSEEGSDDPTPPLPQLDTSEESSDAEWIPQPHNSTADGTSGNVAGRGLVSRMVGGLRVDRLPGMEEDGGGSDYEVDAPPTKEHSKARTNRVSNAVRRLRLDRLDGVEENAAYRSDAGSDSRATRRRSTSSRFRKGHASAHADRMLSPASAGHRKPSARNEGGSDADDEVAAMMAGLQIVQEDVNTISMEEDAFMTYVDVTAPIPDKGVAVNEHHVHGCGMTSTEREANLNADGEMMIGIPTGKGDSAQEAVTTAGDDDCFASAGRNPWSSFQGKGAVMVDLGTNSNDTLKARTADLMNHMDRFFFDFRSPYGYTENVVTFHDALFKTQIPYTVCGYVAGTDCTQRIVTSREATDGKSWQESIVQFLFAKVEAGQSNYYKATLNTEESIPAKQVSYSLKGKDLGSIDVTLCICDIEPPEDAADESEFKKWRNDCVKQVKWSRERGCS